MKAWKILAAILSIVALVVGSAAIWIRSIAARRRGEMERRVAAMLAEARLRGAARPVLYGEAVPGRAWDDYDPALATMSRVRPSFGIIERFLARDGDRAKLETLLAAHGAAIDALQVGARRSLGAYPSDWEQGFRVRRAGLSESRFLVMFAACRARVLAEDGKTREALRLLLDAVQFSHDLAHNGFDYGFASDGYRIALEELRDLVTTKPLGRDELNELDLALERADVSLPPTAVCGKNVVLMLGIELLKEPGPHRAFDPTLHLHEKWRFGFSDRILTADAFDRWCEIADRADSDDQGSWAGVRGAQTKLSKENRLSKNPLAHFTPWRLQNALWAREWRARIRLLRAAARVRAGGDLLHLEDPFGVLLLHAEKAGRLRIWSVGPDGVDDGGDDGGRPPIPGISGTFPKDFVIEVER